MKRVAIAALALLVLGATAAPGLAQSNLGSDLGFIAPSASNTEHDRYVDVAPSIPFTFYIWCKIDFTQIGESTQNSTNGIGAWEGYLNVPATVLVLSSVLNPAGALNFPGGPNDYSVGTGSLLSASSATGVALVDVSALVLAAVSDVTIDMGPALQPTFETATKPMWQEWLAINGCTNTVTGDPFKCFRFFDNVGDLVLNPVATVPVDETSFGTIKAGY